MDKIPFTRLHLTGREMDHLRQAIESGHLNGDGPFTRKCQAWLEAETGAAKALLTPSGSSALDMSALLTGIAPGDEIIMPSYTFVSTANAFALRGAVPVFIDVRADTVNIDENLIEAAITPRTKAIVPVHYAGVACAMDEINDIARRHKLIVIEDAAQGIGATYKGRALGTLSDIGCMSFHGTKNVVAGEGGAVFVNNPAFVENAEVVREKGTNRSRFLRGEVDKYTWQALGTSFLPSELIAAFLWAQLPDTKTITSRRVDLWNRYQDAFADLEKSGRLQRPTVPQYCGHNAHVYYLVLESVEQRERLRQYLSDAGVTASAHYVPLHEAPAGKKLGRAHGSFTATGKIANGLLRLPLYADLTESDQGRVIDLVLRF